MRIRPLGILVPVVFGLAVTVLADPPVPPPVTPPPPSGSPASSGGGATEQVLYVVRVNPETRKILVFRMSAPLEGALMLNSIRDYTYDLVLDEMEPQREFLTTAQVRRSLEKHPEYKKEKEEFDKTHKGKKFDVDTWLAGDKSPLKKSDTVVLINQQGITEWTAGGKEPALFTSIYFTGYFYLVDEANKKILAYQIQSGRLNFVSARKWDYDDRLEIYDKKLHATTSADFPKYMSMKEIKAEVERQEKEKKEAEKENK